MTSSGGGNGWEDFVGMGISCWGCGVGSRGRVARNAERAFGILCRICHRGEGKQNMRQAENISRAVPGRACERGQGGAICLRPSTLRSGSASPSSMRSQWEALRHHSLAFHGPRRSGVRRSLGKSSPAVAAVLDGNTLGGALAGVRIEDSLAQADVLGRGFHELVDVDVFDGAFE